MELNKTAAMAHLVMATFAARTAAHLAHFNTTSFEKHKALDNFYSGLLDPIDKIVEIFQGRYDIIQSYPTHGEVQFTDPVELVTKYGKDVEELRKLIPQDTDIQNIVDELSALSAHVLYQFKLK